MNQDPIHINPAHKGEFTAKAKKHGMSVQQFAAYVLAHKDQFDGATIKQANFAKNAAGFNHLPATSKLLGK